MENHTLIAYLYGELDEAAAEHVRRQLAQDPTARAACERLLATRQTLHTLPDVAAAPPLLFGTPPVRRLEPRAVRWTAVAAVLVAGLLAAAWLDVRIRFDDREVSIRLGAPPVAQPASVVAAPVAARAASQALPPPDSTLLHRLAALERQLPALRRQVRHQKAAGPLHAGLTPAQVTALLADLQQENYETMQQLVAAAGQQQHLYSQQLLGQLTDYLAAQRKDDLQRINAVLNTIVSSTDEKQQQTDEVLTQLLSRLNEPPRKGQQ